MTEYFMYKTERIRPEGGDHINNQVKYWCEPLGVISHGLTDDNPYRLFGQVASLFRAGDVITTMKESVISGDKEEIALNEPLSHDELRILAVQVLGALGKVR